MPNAEQPFDAAASRFICTPQLPMRPMRGANSPELWMHPDAKDTGFNDPHFDHYHCPNCGLNFKVEVGDA